MYYSWFLGAARAPARKFFSVQATLNRHKRLEEVGVEEVEVEVEE